MYNPKQAASMFYPSIESKKGSIVINKTQIESAFQRSTNEVEIKMISGDVFVININPTMLGELIYELGEIQHKSSQVVTP
jgi:hypothetical protein